MALYVKNADGTFTQMSPAAEAAARGNPANLIGNDSGFDIVLPAQVAAQIKAQQSIANNLALITVPLSAVGQGLQTQLALGVAVTSTGAPALNGTYAVDDQTRAMATAEIVYLLSTAPTSTFSNGKATLPWLDTAGAVHTFTVAQFQALWQAVAQYVTACRIVAAQQAVGVAAPISPGANVQAFTAVATAVATATSGGTPVPLGTAAAFPSNQVTIP
jgi:hypothetical protein